MTGERDRLMERRELVVRDLEELDLQVAEGEVDGSTAEGLRRSYRSELERIDAGLARMAPASPRPSKGGAAPTGRPASKPPQARARQAPRSTRRVVVGGLVIVAALTAAIAFAARDTEPDTSVAAGPGELTVDPATVSDEELERVVAANPGITAMRMALADRYFEAEDYSSALGHYLYIAENTVSPAEESKALTRVGWMAYITDQAEAADDYLELALQADPGNSEAILYRGFVTLYGLEDPETAIPQLEAALRLDNISDGVVSQIEEALADARSGGTP